MVSGPQVSSVFSWWLSHVSVASTEVPTAVLFLYFIPKPIQAFPTFSLDYDFKLWLQDVVFQSLSLVQLFVTPWTAVCQASLFITSYQSLLKLMSIELVMLSNHLILCCPLLLLSSILHSLKVFFNESVLHIRQPKYWSFSFCISPSNEYAGLISFRIGWFYLLSVQGTVKNLLQYCSSKASILRHSAFFMVQRSHPCMTTGKSIAFIRWTFVSNWLSLFFNMLPRLVISSLLFQGASIF